MQVFQRATAVRECHGVARAQGDYPVIACNCIRISAQTLQGVTQIKVAAGKCGIDLQPGLETLNSLVDRVQFHQRVTTVDKRVRIVGAQLDRLIKTRNRLSKAPDFNQCTALVAQCFGKGWL